MNPPRPGLCSPIKIIRVIDGDTIKVELTRTFNVRLVHANSKSQQFNCPEKNTAEGQEAKVFVESVVKDKDITLFVPTGEDQKLMDINSFNRILGEIWINDKSNNESNNESNSERLTDVLLEKGYGELK